MRGRDQDQEAARAFQTRAANGVAMFELKPVLNADGTYTNVEYVTIITPGDPRAAPCKKVTDAIRQKYAFYYDQWRRGLEVSREGSPLEMWPLMTPALVRMLKVQNIFTVEELAQVADTALAGVPMGETLRRQAREWLKAKADSDAVANSVREKDAVIQANKILESQLHDLASRLSAMEAERAAPVVEDLPDLVDPDPDAPFPSRRGPGRPRKE